MQIETPRLILRRWAAADLSPFAQMNRDPEVMKWMPQNLDRDQSDHLAAYADGLFEQYGFGLFVLQLKVGNEFVGFTGLSVPRFTAPFTPCVEIGWRVAQAHWGQGYATEAAQAVLGLSFGQWGLKEVVSFTTAGNLSSRRVMEKIGMLRSPKEDFDHPSLGVDSPLKRHVLYRLGIDRWREISGL